MEVKGYSEKYQKGVMACLKRNYEWMNTKSDEELSEWLKPIVSYKWECEFPIEQYPYKFGMVFLDDDQNVVGYLGLIYSNQYIDGQWKVVVNPTTWAIDQKYRFNTIKYTSLANKTADIVIDYSSSKSVSEISLKLFHYQVIDEIGYFFYPIPYFGKKHIRIKKISDGKQIEDTYIKKIFEDHNEYDIKCLEVSDKEKKEYVFYRTQKRAEIIKKVIPLNAINILYTSNSAFFGKHFKEIIWRMQRMEFAAVKTDSRYFAFDTSKFNKKTSQYEINRLMLDNTQSVKSMSSMYTELSLLQLY